MKLLIYLLPLLFLGCTAQHQTNVTFKEYDVHKQASPSLYSLADGNVSQHFPQTGFYPLAHYYDAFLARVELIKRAKKSIDLQYFIFSDDETSALFADEIIKAADRGVKVRMLVDDLLLKYRDKVTASIASHPNIDIKLFNPTSNRGTFGWIQMGLSLGKYGRRMHNKMLIVDNSAVIFGGRNIENVYFGVDKNDIFIDNDILAIGPLAADASNKFEAYWNFDRSVDIHDIYRGDLMTQEEIDQLDRSSFERFKKSDYIEDLRQRRLYSYFQTGKIPMMYGNAELYYDLPEKIITPEEDPSAHISTQLNDIDGIKKTLYIVNPYFVPNDEMMERFERLRDRGIEIKILTNSLATNDAIPVYSEYSKYHKKLLRLGVHLYEINPHAVEYVFKSHQYSKNRHPKTSLHAKTMIVDDRYFIIGSRNLDPRSDKVNTEVSVIIDSKPLSDFESSMYDYFIRLDNAYELSLQQAPSQSCVVTCVPTDGTQLVWTTRKDGEVVHYYDNDADAGFWRRLGANILRYIPLGNHI